MQFTFIFSLIFAVIVAIFALLNRDIVTVDIFFTQFETQQAVVILVSAFLGAILVYLLDLVKKIKSGFKNKDLEKKNKGLTLEIEKLTSEVESYASQNVDLMDENNQLREKLDNTSKVQVSNVIKADVKDESETGVNITK